MLFNSSRVVSSNGHGFRLLSIPRWWRFDVAARWQSHELTLSRRWLLRPCARRFCFAGGGIDPCARSPCAAARLESVDTSSRAGGGEHEHDGAQVPYVASLLHHGVSTPRNMLQGRYACHMARHLCQQNTSCAASTTCHFGPFRHAIHIYFGWLDSLVVSTYAWKSHAPLQYILYVTRYTSLPRPK